MDSRDAVLELILELLAEDEFRAGPSAGHGAAGLPARLAADAGHDRRVARRRRRERAHPLTVRLVKGAYWDHEIVEAAPARLGRRRCSSVKADSDRNFEQLTRRLLDAAPTAAGCAAIASHNLRSVAHAIAYNRLDRRRRRATSSCRSCAASATRCRRRSPPRACACAPTARSATSWPAWPTSCGGCSRTPPTTRSCTSRRAACRSRSCCAAAGAAHGVKPFAQRADPRAAARAGPRAARRRAARRTTREPPLRVPVWIGDERARGRRARLDRPRRPRPRRRARPRRRRRTRSTPRWRRAARRATWGDDAGRAARRGADRAPRSGCASGGSRSPRSRCASAAKPWREADADVCEAIDFLEYYARGGASTLAQGAPAAARCPASATSCATRRAASSRSSRPGTSRSRSRSG